MAAAFALVEVFLADDFAAVAAFLAFAGAFLAAAFALVENYYPPFVEAKALEIGPQLQATFSMANQAGLKIAFGTDSGVSPHGENAKEFKLMIDAGMSEKEAILSATLNASDLLGKNNEIGSLAQGKLADLIGVSENPLEDITILETVDFVMKGGKVVKQP